MPKTNFASQYLSDDEVLEFQALVVEIMGKKITKQDALDQGTRLIVLFEALQKFEPIQLSYKDAVANTNQKNENAEK